MFLKRSEEVLAYPGLRGLDRSDMRLAAGTLLTHFLSIILLITHTRDSPEHKQSHYLDIPSFPLQFRWVGRHPPRKEPCLAKPVKQTCCSVLKLVSVAQIRAFVVSPFCDLTDVSMKSFLLSPFRFL